MNAIMNLYKSYTFWQILSKIPSSAQQLDNVNKMVEPVFEIQHET